MPRFSNRWYARRPYLKLGSSLVEFFNSPVRFLKESNTIESQFEKPYEGGHYQDIQFKIPDPDWPTWHFGQAALPKAPRPPFPYNIDPRDRFRPECPCCFFVWWGDCSNEELNGGQFMPVFSDYPYSSATHKWTISGNYVNFRTYPPAANANATAAFAHAAYFDFDQNALTGDGFAFVTLCYEIEGICQHCVDYWAPCVQIACPPAVPLSFDDPSTPNTIAAGGTITMYVLDGEGPFDWTTPSTGYSFGSNQTAARNNTLTSATGTCGVHFDEYAEVTVTDACGGSVYFEIRNTSGHWVATGANIHAQTTCGSANLCMVTAAAGFAIGSERWLSWAVTHNRHNSCACTRIGSNWGGWTGGGGAVLPPISPFTFWSVYHDGGGGCGECTNANDGLDLMRCRYYVWSC